MDLGIVASKYEFDLFSDAADLSIKELLRLAVRTFKLRQPKTKGGNEI